MELSQSERELLITVLEFRINDLCSKDVQTLTYNVQLREIMKEAIASQLQVLYEIIKKLKNEEVSL